MKKILLLAVFSVYCLSETSYGGEMIKLPKPIYEGKTSVEKAILERRSVRDYKDKPLQISEISQILWSAQGITEKGNGFRSAPSAGATYPLEVYVVVGNVNDLPCGIYKYEPQEHGLVKILEGDKREELCSAAHGQSSVVDASAVLVFSAVYERTTHRYGERGIRYTHMEVGHAGQNVHLQAVSLNLGTVVIGAFNDSQVKKVINLPKEEEPLYLMPVGKVK